MASLRSFFKTVVIFSTRYNPIKAYKKRHIPAKLPDDFQAAILRPSYETKLPVRFSPFNTQGGSRGPRVNFDDIYDGDKGKAEGQQNPKRQVTANLPLPTFQGTPAAILAPTAPLPLAVPRMTTALLTPTIPLTPTYTKPTALRTPDDARPDTHVLPSAALSAASARSAAACDHTPRTSTKHVGRHLVNGRKGKSGARSIGGRRRFR